MPNSTITHEEKPSKRKPHARNDSVVTNTPASKSDDDASTDIEYSSHTGPDGCNSQHFATGVNSGSPALSEVTLQPSPGRASSDPQQVDIPVSAFSASSSGAKSPISVERSNIELGPGSSLNDDDESDSALRSPGSEIPRPIMRASLLTAAIEEARSKQMPDLGPWAGLSPPCITAPRELNDGHDSIVARDVTIKPCLKSPTLSYEELEICVHEHAFRALRIMLASAESPISSPRAFDEVYYDAHRHSEEPLRVLGRGRTCAVYQRNGKESVIKLVSEEEHANALWNEYSVLTAIHEHHARHRHLDIDICVPKVHNYFGPESLRQTRNRQMLEQYLGTADRPVGDSFIMERILPVHGLLRTALIRHFSRVSPARQLAINSPENRDCLVRIYLGRAERRRGKRVCWDKGLDIRNFPLYINDLEALGVDCHAHARSMGQTLALLHWSCELDGAGIEFALGSPRRAEIENETYTASQIACLPPRSTTRLELRGRAAGLRLWCLDFNETSATAFAEREQKDEDSAANAAEMRKLAEAFMANDPYFPRPLSGKVYRYGLWRAFADEYLRVGRAVRGEGRLDFPARFIDAVTVAQRARLDARSSRHGSLPRPVRVSTAVRALDYAMSRLTPTGTLDRRLEEGLSMSEEGLALCLGQKIQDWTQ